MLQAPILRFDTLDSTNNRAAQIIDADKSQPGLTIVCHQQTAGKGQRGNPWLDNADESLLMSIVLQPERPIAEQFCFSAAIAVAIADVLQNLDRTIHVNIKFPNDIIVNDKKAAGILIENSIRGSVWTHCIVGVGLNVMQDHFDPDLQHAISLFLATQKTWVKEGLLLAIRQKIIEYTLNLDADKMLERYNQLLYKRGHTQDFAEGDVVWKARICGVDAAGMLTLRHDDGTVKSYPWGRLRWIW